MTVLEMMLDAPLLGVDGDVYHAVPLAQVARLAADNPPGVLQAVCGVDVRLVPMEAEGRRRAGLWPPRVSTLPEGFTRCRVCHVNTGKRSPRVEHREVAS